MSLLTATLSSRCSWLCAHASLDVLDALAWGELAPGESRRTLRHVQRCTACRRRLEWIKRLPCALERATSVSFQANARQVVERRRRGDRVILPAPLQDLRGDYRA